MIGTTCLKGEKESGCKKAYPNYMEEGSRDARYYPGCIATDWTEEKLAIKIEQIETYLRTDRKFLPDVLGLCEVEMKKLLR